jgi:hypothetical protein
MTCERIEDLLSSYLEGDLGADEKGLVDLHLEACRDCRSLLAALKEIRSALSGLPELEISQSLRTRLQTIPAKTKRLGPSLDFLLRPSLQPVFGAAAVLMTLVSFYLFGPNKAAIDRSIDRTVHQGYSQVERLFAKAGFVKDRLEARKDSLLVSLGNLELFDRNKDQTQH